MLTLKREHINFSSRRRKLTNTIEVRLNRCGAFTVFMRKDRFPQGNVGWEAREYHGKRFKHYYGWNLWDPDDVHVWLRRVRYCIRNPHFVIEILCRYCGRNLDYLCGGEICEKCCPQVNKKGL